MFVKAPVVGYWQMVVVVVVWAHAMIGLHFWLRLRPWYARLQAPALGVAVLVPVLSLLGMIEAGRQVIALAADPGWTGEAFAAMIPPSPEATGLLEKITRSLIRVFIGSVAAVLLARLDRRLWRRRHGLVRIGYPDGRFVEVAPGASAFEASRIGGIPHAHVCGGRGRCSTCRIRVRGETGSIEPPGPDELCVLRRIGATPNIRLACQLRPRGTVEVTPLLPPFAQSAEGRTRVGLTHGSEREIAILFADIRGFTALEGRLPYAQAGCRAALAFAQLMSERLAKLNVSLAQELDRPLRIGVGIHCGPVIVGEMGYGSAAAITAIGDVVNTASRLKELTKEYDCELVVSEETVHRAGYDLSAFPRHEIELRGKREMLAIRILEAAAELPDFPLFSRSRALPA